ncbi:MAG: creatininase family protein [Candidatus Bathyarchaeota archaeon]|nr:creatininase family protein [Candidatus Bathyarchaeota archaeon]
MERKSKPLVFLDEMTWVEVRDRLKESKIALVPIGSVEEHGKHLPLGTDNFVLMEVIKRGVGLAAQEVKPVVAPLIPYGWDEWAMKWPGTISLSNETSKAVLRDVCVSLIRHGFEKIVIVDGCGANFMAVDPLVHELALETGAFIVHYKPSLSTTKLKQKIKETKIHDVHSGETETSLAVACGVRARMDLAEGYEGYPPFLTKIRKEYGAKGSWPWPHLHESGAWGDPSRASKEKGEKLLNCAAEKLADFLRELKEVDDPYKVG